MLSLKEKNQEQVLGFSHLLRDTALTEVDDTIIAGNRSCEICLECVNDSIDTEAEEEDEEDADSKEDEEFEPSHDTNLSCPILWAGGRLTRG